MSGGGPILVVDDSLSVRRAVGRMLAPLGLTITEATDGAQAIERLAQERPRLVICDLMLPGHDGYEICRHVRAQPALAEVPVLLISGVSSPEMEERAVAVGAAGVLAKPFTAQSLIERVGELLPAADGGPSVAPADDPIGDLLRALEALPRARAAYLLEPGSGSGRSAGGRPAPDRLVDLLRRAAELSAELGLGELASSFLEGDAGNLVMQRLGRATIVVHFEHGVLLGLARHQVRQLCCRVEPTTTQPEGDRSGSHSR